MYHRPRMCRTCLQMSRGDFKFVSLDAGDPLWESNSPNLKEQLLTLVPEMKLDGSGTVMCTSCFIALRTGYEFKKMCQFTEQRFQNYNYKYRRPFGVGPGSAQFHVTLNETRKTQNNKNGYYGCQNINFLQADTSIDITEHHLYDASKPPPRKDFLKDPLIDQVIKTPIESLPPAKVEEKPAPAEVKPIDIKPVEAKPIIESKPVEIKPVVPEKQVDVKPATIQIKIAEVIKEIKVPEIKRQQVARKKITASLHIRKKYKIGSEISILKSENRSVVSKVDAIPENKSVNKLDMIIKRACDEIEYLKENYITPKSLSCYSKIVRLSKQDNLEKLNKEADSYYFEALETEVSCQHCSKTFDTRFKLNIHDIETHLDKQVRKCAECDREFVNEVNLKQHMDDDHTKALIPNLEEIQVPLEKIVEECNESKATDVEMEKTEEEAHDPLIDVQSEVKDMNEKTVESKESNIEHEKDALLVVSKVVEDKLKFDDNKKCRPSYEDDDEDFILEDNAFNISDSEDESIDIEINESEINQLLQDDYEGKINKSITSKTGDLNNKKIKEEKELPKTSFVEVVILPKNSIVENVKVAKILSNSVLENKVEKLLSKKQIEEKVNKLAEIQFVEVKRVVPKQINTSPTEEKILWKNPNANRERKEVSKTNLNYQILKSKVQKGEVKKDSQKVQLDGPSRDSVHKELPKITLTSQLKEDSKKESSKIAKESPKATTSTLTKIEKDVSKNQITVDKIEKVSPKKPAAAPVIASKPKESPKKVNVQTEKNKGQKESPQNQDKPALEKGNKLKETPKVQKESSKTQDTPTVVKLENKIKESVEVKADVQKESPKKEDKLTLEKGKVEVKTVVQKESPKKQDKPIVEKGNKLKELVEVKNDVQKESPKKQDKPAVEKGNKLKELVEVKTDVQKESPKKQDKPTVEKGNKLKELVEVKTDVQKQSPKKQDKPTVEKGNKLKELAEVKTDVQKQSPKKQDKPTVEKGNKLKELVEVKTDVQKQSPKKQDKPSVEEGNKLKELVEVKIDVQKESPKKQDKPTLEKGNILKEVVEVKTDLQKESPKKQDKPTVEKGNKLKELEVKTDVQMESAEVITKESPKKKEKTSPEKGITLKESPEVKTSVPDVHKESPVKQDEVILEEENKLKESPEVKDGVQRESPKSKDNLTPEKGNKLKESVEVETSVPKESPAIQKESPKKQDPIVFEKENTLELPETTVESKPTDSSPKKTDDQKEDGASHKEPDTQAEVPRESPKKKTIPTIPKVNKQKELSENKMNAMITEVQEKSKKPDVPVIERKESLEIEMVQTKADIPSLERETGSYKQDMPTLENVNKVVNEIPPKMHLDPPVLQNETNIEQPQVQLNPENNVKDVKMDVDPPILENEINIELPTMQTVIPKSPTKIIKEKKEIEPKYVKPYWYKYINYTKCFICQKLCRNKLQLLQHCKFVHVPITTPPKTVEKEEVIISENKVEITESDAIKLYKKDNTPYKCNICDKQVLAKEYLDIHMHIHIPYSFAYDNDRVDNFICYICDKNFPKDRFMKLHNLQVHQARHTVCKTCKRLFKSEFWYSRHKCVVQTTPATTVEQKEEIEDDTKINPHQCNVCDRRFGKLRFLKSHQHRMHPEAYKINFGDVNASNSNTLSESTSETNKSIDVKVVKDLKEIKANPKDESAEGTTVKNIFDDELKFLKSSESNFKRKSTDRMPKLQCDFCGTMICENKYDSHIAEHNEKRMLKGRKSDEKLPESTTTPDTPTVSTPTVVDAETTATTETTPNPIPGTEKTFMKCDFCFRLFQRKYHLVNHMKKHHEDMPQNLEAQSGNEENETTEECEEIETSRNESIELLECCGRQFKLKAHYARHCSTKHPDIFYKSTPSKPASPIPPLDVSAIVSTRRSTTFKTTKENDNESVSNEEPIKEKRVIKRKTLDLIEPTEQVKKQKVTNSESLSTPENLKRKKTTSDSDSESARKKKVPPPPPAPPVESEEGEGALYKYQCSTCARKFKQYNQLRDHNNVHTGDRPYKCLFCKPVRGFTQTSSLYVHFRRVHVAIVNNVEWEPYSKNGNCLICSTVFEKHSEMFQHAKDFYVESGYECKVCNENFTMSCHYRVHNGNPSEAEAENDTASNNSEESVRCDPCNKAFENRRMLKVHKKSLAHVQQVQTLKKQSNHKKDDDSTTIEGLANSVGDILKTLSGMKKHKCSVCDVTFTKKWELKRHKREVHGLDIRRRKSRSVVEDEPEDDEQEASSSTDVPFLDENDILKSITAKRRPSVLSENSDDKLDNQTDFEECDDTVDQSSQSSSQEDDSESVKASYDDTADFDTMKLVESIHLPDEVIDEVISEETSSEILSSQMESTVEEVAFNVGYPSSSDDFPQDIIESDGVTYTNMRGVPIDSLE